MDLSNLGNSALNVILVLAILVALVVIHEFGHFVMARLAGVRVHEFGIGLPPRALTYYQGKETAYTLNWLPLGGFVRLEGEDGDQADDPRSFSHQSLKRRTVILLAGVAMNLLLALVIFILIAGFADPSVDIRVNGLAPNTTAGGVAPSVAAGIRPAKVIGGTADAPQYDDSGDRITAIDGQQFAFFDAGPTGEPNAGIRYLRAHAGQTVTLTLLHADGTSQDVAVKLNTSDVANNAPLVNGATGQGVLGIVG